jgi:hypothetical protein
MNCNWWGILISMFFVFWFDVCWLQRKHRGKNPTGNLWTKVQTSGIGDPPQRYRVQSELFQLRAISRIVQWKDANSGNKGFAVFSVHMDNSMCHNGHKVFKKLALRSTERAPRPPDSPDLSLCDFWLFGVWK